MKWLHIRCCLEKRKDGGKSFWPFLMVCHVVQVQTQFAKNQDILPHVNFADEVQQEIVSSQFVTKEAGGEECEQFHSGNLLHRRNVLLRNHGIVVPQFGEVENMQSWNQGGRRQRRRSGHHGVILFVSSSHGRIKTDDSNKLQQVLELNISIPNVIQLDNTSFAITGGKGKVQPQGTLNLLNMKTSTSP